jgi:nitrilase
VAPAGYDMSEAIALRARAHCFEGKVFTIVSCSTIDQAIIEKVAGEDQVIREMFQRPNSALSGICDPTGKFISDVLIDEEGITYAEIDLRQCIQPKQMHDIVGHYNRFDIFDLQVDARPWRAIGIDGSMRPVSPTAEPTNPGATLG